MTEDPRERNERLWVEKMAEQESEKITPQTYIDMNKEFEEDDIPFRIAVPTQEAIDKWQSQPAPAYKTPPAIDMVQQMWDEIGGRQ